MRKAKRAKIGEYVLATKYWDKDPHDPWQFGFISEVTENVKGLFYIVDGSWRVWKNVFRISAEEGKKWIEFWGHIDEDKK